MASVDIKTLQSVAAAVPASPAPSKGAGGTGVKVPIPQQASQPVAAPAPLKPVPIRSQAMSQFIGKVVEQAVRTQSGANLYVKRQVFEPTNDVVVRVIDVAKQKVVREIPNLKYLIIVTNLLQISGVNVDEKA